MEPLVIVLIVVVVVLVLALAAIGMLLARRRRSKQLREHYGPEYERSLAETGDPKSAEAALRDREKRHSELDIRPLEPRQRADFEDRWTVVQRDFVDDPARAVHDADALVTEIMRTRGYPVDDFDRRAEDVSVEHPRVATHYREARQVAQAVRRGEVDTELQREAVTSYRSLVEALLESDGSLGDSANGTASRHRRDDGVEHDRRDHRRDDRRDDRTDTEERTR